MKKKPAKHFSDNFEVEKVGGLLQYIRKCEREDYDVTCVCFDGETLENEDLSAVSFEDVKMSGCTFTKCDFTKSSFINVHLHNCAFLQCDLPNSRILRSRLESSSFMGSTFTSLFMQCSDALECNFRYTNFTKSDFDDVCLTECDFTEAFLAQCELSDVTTVRSKFMQTDFFCTKLGKMDFSTSVLSGIGLSDNAFELRGAVVTSEQALELSKLLGIVISD